MSVVIPEEPTKVMLTFDQVESLRRAGKDNSFGWCVALGGAACGFFQNVLNTIGAIAAPDKEPAWNDIALSMVCVAAFAGAIAKYTEHKRNSDSTDDFVAKLKAQKPIDVS